MTNETQGADARSLEDEIRYAAREMRFSGNSSYVIELLERAAQALTERPEPSDDSELFPDPHPALTREHIYMIYGAGWAAGRDFKARSVEELAQHYATHARDYADRYLAERPEVEREPDALAELRYRDGYTNGWDDALESITTHAKSNMVLGQPATVEPRAQQEPSRKKSYMEKEGFGYE